MSERNVYYEHDIKKKSDVRRVSGRHIFLL